MESSSFQQNSSLRTFSPKSSFTSAFKSVSRVQMILCSSTLIAICLSKFKTETVCTSCIAHSKCIFYVILSLTICFRHRRRKIRRRTEKKKNRSFIKWNDSLSYSYKQQTVNLWYGIIMWMVNGELCNAWAPPRFMWMACNDSMWFIPNFHSFPNKKNFSHSHNDFMFRKYEHEYVQHTMYDMRHMKSTNIVSSR